MAGIYVHIPFCKKKCSYCDFASYPDECGKTEAYFACLYREIKGKGESQKGKVFDTVYFGGGTPSLPHQKFIVGALKQIKNCFTLSKNPEITLELNPGTVNKEKIEAYKKAGVNRFSVGLQAGNDRELKRLGRIHTVRDFSEAAGLLNGENFSVDLLIGTHDQTFDELKEGIDLAVKAGASHLSLYALTCEEGTPVYTDYLNGDLPSDDEVADLYEQAVAYLKTLGFSRYEVSNFCKTGKESRHNLTYWTRGEYVGLGVSASSFLAGRRSTNTFSIDEYVNAVILNKVPEISSETLSKEDEMFETVMLGLRLEKGFSLDEFEQKFGVRAETEFSDSLKKNEKYLQIKDGYLSVKPEYMYVENGIIIDFMKD